jgi:hypothetical protein
MVSNSLRAPDERLRQTATGAPPPGRHIVVDCDGCELHVAPRLRVSLMM